MVLGSDVIGSLVSNGGASSPLGNSSHRLGWGVFTPARLYWNLLGAFLLGLDYTCDTNASCRV